MTVTAATIGAALAAHGLTTPSELANILAMTADSRRAHLRVMVSRLRDKTGYPADEIITGIFEMAVGNGIAWGVRPIWSGMRDGLPYEVLLAILVNEATWGDVLDAIADPATFGVHKSGTKTGFHFGWPKGLPSDFADQVKSALGTHASTGTSSSMTTFASISFDSLLTAVDRLTRDRLMAEIARAEAEGTGTERFYTKDYQVSVSVEIGKEIGRAGSRPDAAAIEAMLNLRADDNLPKYLDMGVELPTNADAEAVVKQYKDMHPGQFAATPSGDGDGPSPAAPAAPIPADIITIDPGIAVAINSMLQTVTKGKVTDINSVFAGAAQLAREAAEKDEELRKLKQKIAQAPLVTPKIEAVAHTGIPAGKVVMKNAAELFRSPGRPKHPALDFEVPTFEWDHPHPYVPAIDEHYKFKAWSVVKLLFALSNNKKAWLSGHTGTGKTTFVQQVAARLNWPVIRINFDSEITRMDLLGRDVIKNDGGVTKSEFVEGIVVQALQQPCILLCDEVDFIRPDVAYVFQRILEDAGLLLNEDGGRLVHPHPMFRVIATANTKGQGDEYGAYQGARQQSQAFLDRFATWMTVDYMGPAEEVKLITDRVPGCKADMAEQIAKLAKEIRTGFVQGNIGQTVSPRGLVALAEGIVFFSGLTKDVKEAVGLALETTVLDKASDQDKGTIKEYVARVFK